MAASIKDLKGNTKLGAIYANTYNESVRRTEFVNRTFVVEDNQASLSFDYNNNKYNKEVLWGALGNVTLQLASNHKIAWKNIFNVNANKYVTERTG